MTSSPPPEAPHFRGKTLTPESPRPLHIPEPSNIPVLENQIDPIFNLMSTHIEPPHALRDLTAMDHEIAHRLAENNMTQYSTADADGDEDDLYGTSDPFENGNTREKDDSYISLGKDEVDTALQQSESSLNQIQSPSLADQHSATVAAYDSSIAPTQNDANPTNISPPSGDSSPSFQEPHDPSQDTSMNTDQSSSAEEAEDDDGADRKSNSQLKKEEDAEEDVANEGVNFQSLLDNISQSNVTASQADHPPPPTSTSSASSSVNVPSTAFPPPIGLPPRPPPQESPAIHPHYAPGQDIRTYHQTPAPYTNALPTQTSLASNSYRPSQGYVHPVVAAGAPGTSSAPNGLPPPPMATFQQPQRISTESQNSPINQQFQQRDLGGKNGSASGPASATDGSNDGPWPPQLERRYNEFLEKERIYVTEGLWDRFPQGSRLFVGNLPTESVSKRDLFYIFHKYGDLAQISIKQAYGFIQYLDAECCQRALRAEQGLRIKDRNMHLEISKPQKNSRNAAATREGDNLRASARRRSRSPGHGRRSPASNQRFSGDRYVGGNVPFSDFRDEPRRRDDYRSARSPSPRGFRQRDAYRGPRDRSPDRYYGRGRERSRSPQYGRGPQYRSPSPRRRQLDEDASLPIPRRNPRDIPDVQIILIEELDRAFVAYIEKSFRDRTLRPEIMMLPRMVPLDAVVRRQILEGVAAVVKLSRSAQITGKIPLQVFDRSKDPTNVSFEEYEDLEAHIAAELVIRAKATTAAATGPRNQPFGAPQFPSNVQLPNQQQQQQQQPSAAAQPNIANLITSLDGPALQKLLGAMQQSPQQPQAPQFPPPQQHQGPPAQNPDLTALLNNVMRQTQQPPPQQQQMPPQQGYPYPQPQPVQNPQPYPYGGPGPSNLYQSGPPNQQQAVPNQYQQQQHVQNIMEQLAKWKQ
ncbi:MAG: hypothetical protein MMC33_000305 [Icmadophila ericetorum]|nr:hypothetical protein [Icmadophila ericetorum]